MYNRPIVSLFFYYFLRYPKNQESHFDTENAQNLKKIFKTIFVYIFTVIKHNFTEKNENDELNEAEFLANEEFNNRDSASSVSEVSVYIYFLLFAK